ncbi:MAG: mechanosensitive ion channel domain-containing protein [Candidatus Gastranaerophilaceae bacterium]
MMHNKYLNRIFLAITACLLLILPSFSENIKNASPVKLGDKDVIYIKIGVGSFSALNRAASASKKLEKIAKDPYYDINSITLSENENSTDIVADDIIILTVSQKDAQIDKKPRQFLAREDLRIIRQSIKEYREQYSAKSIILGTIYTVIATIGLIVLLVLLNFLYRKIIQKFETYKKEEIEAVYLQDLKLLSKEKIAFWSRTGLNLLRILTIFALICSYLILVLSLYPWTFPLASKLINSFLTMISHIGISFISYLPNLLFIIVTALAAYYISKLIDYIFEAIEKGIISFSWFYTEWIDLTRQLSKLFIIALAAALIYPHLPGAKSNVFKGFSIFIGIIVSIGSTRLMSNMISGIILTYTRAFSRGERVKIADNYGDIVEKDLLVTRIKTIKNEIISIPNSKVLDSEIINYSKLALDNGLILHTEVTIGYDVPREQAEALLIQAAKNTTDIIEDKEPFVFKKSLDDYYITYELNAFTDKPQAQANTYSELNKNIIDIFYNEDIELLSPHYYALRDGNHITIPEKYLPEHYKRPSFNIKIDKY